MGNEKSYDKVKYNNEYNKEKYDKILIAVRKGKKAEWTAKAKAEGLSLTAYIIKKVEGENAMYPYEPMPASELIRAETIRGNEYKVVKTYVMVPYGEHHDKTGAIVKDGGPAPMYEVFKNGQRFITRYTEAECMAIIEEIRNAK